MLRGCQRQYASGLAREQINVNQLMQKTCSSQQKEEKAPALAVAAPVSKEATIVQQMEITTAMAVAKGRRFANKSSASLWLDLLPMLLVSNA